MAIYRGEDKLTWRGGIHELGGKIGKLLKYIVFSDGNIFTAPPITLYRG
jgi:hypothetical protein